MTKQEEIAENKLQRELIRDGVILNITHVCPNMLKKEIVLLADNILRDAASQGVVIKVERELPENPHYLVYTPRITGSKGAGYNEAQRDMKEAGYVAVEPLIKEIEK